jgi:hypothetical protein
LDGLIRGIGRFCVAVAVKVSESQGMVSPWIERTEADATLTPFDCSLGFSGPMVRAEDRADVIFAASDEISKMIEPRC